MNKPNKNKNNENDDDNDEIKNKIKKEFCNLMLFSINHDNKERDREMNIISHVN